MAGLLSRFLSWLGSLIRTREDEQIIEMFNNTWRTLRVKGFRFTVDPIEVYNSREYKDGLKRIEAIFRNR